MVGLFASLLPGASGVSFAMIACSSALTSPRFSSPDHERRADYGQHYAQRAVDGRKRLVDGERDQDGQDRREGVGRGRHDRRLAAAQGDREEEGADRVQQLRAERERRCLPGTPPGKPPIIKKAIGKSRRPLSAM